jgi:hypothetical protein
MQIVVHLTVSQISPSLFSVLHCFPSPFSSLHNLNCCIFKYAFFLLPLQIYG